MKLENVFLLKGKAKLNLAISSEHFARVGTKQFLARSKRDAWTRVSTNKRTVFVSNDQSKAWKQFN